MAMLTRMLHNDRITAANDVSSRQAQFAQSQWCYSKSFDTACPLGPALVHASQIESMGKVAIEGQLDGEVVQKCALE
jgi:2-keto-4-pentenoate hydratase/2-oxohepta-3-ene-1,7-dioic acid hydratase in catechol pathway